MDKSMKRARITSQLIIWFSFNYQTIIIYIIYLFDIQYIRQNQEGTWIINGEFETIFQPISFWLASHN